MANFRNVDVFVKPRHDLQTKSAVGGIITLIAAVSAGILFLAQMYWYIVGTTQHSLHLSESRSIPLIPGHTMDPFVNRMFEMKGKIPLKIHITFPHISCDKLEIKLDGGDLTPKDFDPKSKKVVDKRRPTSKELSSAMPDYPKNNHKGGCTIRTTLRIPVVAGHVTITLSRRAWSEAAKEIVQQMQRTSILNSLGPGGGGGGGGENSQQQQQEPPNIGNDFNVTHYIHSIQFGTPFPLAAANPLESRPHTVENHMGGIALVNIQAKLVPTVYKRMFFTQDTYQLSVVDHIVQPDTLVSAGVPLLPGLSLGYDVTPLAVHHIEGRPNIFVFLSSLVSIVGGVFVTVGLVTGCLVHSAQAAVSKKID